MKIEQKIALDHVAILVESISTSLLYCSEKEWPIGTRDKFESEGTEEVYIGNVNTSRLLLMKAIGPGPYQDALKKRGESVHHFGFVCEDVIAFVTQLKTVGWAEHRQSQILWDQTKTFWMQHTGFPLLEISETKTFPTLDFAIRFPLPETLFEVLPGLEKGPPVESLLDCIYRKIV